MPYEKELDVQSFKEVYETDKTRIAVYVYSYNGGTKKLQISRENMVDGAFNFTKLGRMTKDEIEAVLPIIIKAAEGM